jgi:alpha-tubulin suppressor-like RCC1 family protein
VKIVALAGGGEHTCAVLEGGTVTCWGLDDRGQLGDGAFEKLGRVAPQMPCP